MTVILGAGLAGLSASYHLDHDCEIFEKREHAGGHIYSHRLNGFTWDEGPHVSFTKYEYVKQLFSETVNNQFHEIMTHPTNYYHGSWIPHPAQTNMYAIPEPVRSECLKSFLESRTTVDKDRRPENYKEWLYMAFGERFAEEFPTAYTVKYWTTEPKNLSTDWVGERVYFPQVEDVKAGYEHAPTQSKNYLTTARYPMHGGYYAYAARLESNAKIRFSKELKHIDFDKRQIRFTDGSDVKYDRLVNTIAIQELIARSNAPSGVKSAAEALSCSDVLLVNVVVSHPAPVINQWLYVYDTDKYSTRISYTDLFAAGNGTPGKSGLQVEVYFSKYRQQTESIGTIVEKVCNELVEMGLVKDLLSIEEVNTNRIRYANVIFDHPRRESLEEIWTWLGKYGLKRERDDLEPMTDWNKKIEAPEELGDIIMAGRFGQWKYYWTDDCVMRGLHIKKCLGK
jgi:protoporphyrinogen oxidase